jgi:hypothetical protein
MVRRVLEALLLYLSSGRACVERAACGLPTHHHCCAGCGDYRQEQGDQDGKDGDDHQQLKERKSREILSVVFHAPDCPAEVNASAYAVSPRKQRLMTPNLGGQFSSTFRSMDWSNPC